MHTCRLRDVFKGHLSLHAAPFIEFFQTYTLFAINFHLITKSRNGKAVPVGFFDVGSTASILALAMLCACRHNRQCAFRDNRFQKMPPTEQFDKQDQLCERLHSSSS